MNDLRDKIAEYFDANPLSFDHTETADAILALIREEAWQPIETAPKDGTNIILYGPQRVSAFIRSDEKPTGFWGYKDVPPFVFQGHFSSGLWQIGGFGTAQPTHWMPLPKPPSSPESSGVEP